MNLRDRFRRRRHARELMREIRSNLAERVDDLVDSGMSPTQAAQQARLEFGNVTTAVEDSRQAWRSSAARVLDTLRDEGRLAVRRLRARPLATSAAIVTLAASIGAAAATWSLLSAVLLRPLAVRDAGDLVEVGIHEGSSGAGRVFTSYVYPQYLAVRTADVFAGLAVGGLSTELVEIDGATKQRSIFFSNHDYFATLGVSLPLGRAFSVDDDRRDAPLTVVLTDRVWRQVFSADRNVIGREILVRGHAAHIIGVTPRAFQGLALAESLDLFMPLHTIGTVSRSTWNPFAEDGTQSSPTAWIRIVGRLRPGVTNAQTAERLRTTVFTSQGTRNTVILTNVNVAAIPEAARPDMARFTRLLSAAVGLLLLIGCLSVGMLLLIRTEARRHEFSMCLALGASRSRLARGVTIEGALLSLAGAVLGLPVTYAIFAAVRAFELPGKISLGQLNLSVNGQAVSMAIAAAVVATFIVALIAGGFGFNANVADALRARAGGAPRLARRRTRAGLVTAQVAVAMVLVSSAGVLARSLSQALRLNPGYDTSALLTGGGNLAAFGYDAARTAEFFEQLREQLARRSTVAAVALSASQGGMSPGGQLTIDGTRRRMPSFTEFLSIDNYFFQTMRLRVMRGRDFVATDVASAPPVAVVSESLGRFVAQGGDPVGRHISAFFSREGHEPDSIEIVGVVPDVITRVDTLQPLVLYRPLAQQGESPARTVLVRAVGPPPIVAAQTTAIMRELDPRVIPRPMLTIDQQLLSQMAPQHFGMLVLGGLGAIAVLLTVLGTSVLAETVAQLRRRELSIRAALGATRSQLGNAVLRETTRLVGIGLAVGLTLTWIAAGTLRAFLFRVEPLDLLTLSLVAAVILGLALLVSLAPAIRLARVDLASVLRDE